ncbi:gelsolin-like [Pieris brassicae]|uniref:gelsolin-like n=1 Tax=Pieris brassicae TaxID=7116 RepID=UPI001E65FD93|nr:gelsolin-like [Pieris brassicae]
MKLIYVVALALCVCASARVTNRQQSVPISPQITSLNDKDARQKARVHPAFANAGQRAGVEVWRINNFEPTVVSQNDFGKFFKGDSYIILKTTADNKNKLSWDIHYWIGSQATQDESGAAAILTVGLDDKFDGKAVQHREPMGQESQQFKGYFPTGIRYLDGGNPSGFNHVVTNAGSEKKMYQVKGKRNVRVRQVDPLFSSMNKGDCFILEKDNDILVFVGDKAKNVEKLKANSMATQIRDEDHHGRGKVETIDKYSSEVDVQKFFTILGSGSKDLVPEESAGGDDQAFEKTEENVATLSEVSDSTGSVKVKALQKPYTQAQLKPQETYILDTVSGSVYVWLGKQASPKEKTEVMTKAQQLLASKNYPSWVQVVKIPQGTEPAIFKQYFSTWRDAGMSHSRIVRSVGNENAKNNLYEVNIVNHNSISFEKIPEYNQGALLDTEVFVLQMANDVYIWIGKEADLYKRKLITNIAKAFIGEIGNSIQDVVPVKQGMEPPQFINAFRNWDSDMWLKIRSYQEEREMVLRNNEIANFQFYEFINN